MNNPWYDRGRAVLSLLLKTGQTISYHADDDGDLELGIAPDYTVLTTGGYSGTTNVTLNGKTFAFSNACVQDNRTGKMWARVVPQSDIGPVADGKLFWEQWTLAAESVTFAEVGGPGTDTITAAAGTPFNTDALCVGRIFTVAGTVSNDGTYTVAAIANNIITTVEDLANEGPINTDFATTNDLIWDLVDEANSGNGLAGYTDWRVPNIVELKSIIKINGDSPSIDSIVFPSTPSAYHWSSSTAPLTIINAWAIYFSYATTADINKKQKKSFVRLVRS